MSSIKGVLAVALIGLILMTGSALGGNYIRTPDGRLVLQKKGTRQPDMSMYRSPLESKIVDRRWHTNDEMYLANEEYHSSIPFSLEAVKAGLPVAHNLPFQWVTTQEAYWYSRYKLSFFFAQSHMGISMIHGPYWTLKAHELYEKNRLQRDRGERVPSNKDILLGTYLPLFYKRTGWPRVFDDAAPTYLQYASGDPHFTGPIIVEDDFKDPQSGKKGNWGIPRYFLDWRNTRWDHDDMEIVFDMGGLGQTAKKQLLWVEYFFHSDHIEQSPSDKHTQVILLGNDAEEGFSGTMLLFAGFNALLQAKSAFFADARGNNLNGIDPFAYDPRKELRYLPHRIKPDIIYVGDLPERLWALNMADNSSQLWDQASWLWTTAEYEGLATRYENRVFSDNPPVDAGIIEKKTVNVARGLGNVLVKNIDAMHFKNGSMVSEWTPRKGRGDVIYMRDAALAMVALNEFKERRKVNEYEPELGTLAETLVTAQADFFLDVQGADGSFYEGYNVATREGIGENTLSTPQWAGIRALIAAYHTTGETKYAEAARRTYTYLNRAFWHEPSGLYRTKIGDDTVTLTPMDMGMAMGAMREMMFATPAHLTKPQIERFTRWFVQAVDNSGTTMSEDNRTGELSYGANNPDEDGDGIPFLKYGHGKYGIAPVTAHKVAVNIGGTKNMAFQKLKGEPYNAARFTEVKYAYTPRTPQQQEAIVFTGSNLLVGDTRLIEREPLERFNGTLIPLPASLPIARGSDLSGQAIYQRNCAVCHGDRGEGITGKSLAEIITTDRDAIFKVPKQGRFKQAMPPWGTDVDDVGSVLTDEEIWRVVDYIQNELRPQENQPVGTRAGRE